MALIELLHMEGNISNEQEEFPLLRRSNGFVSVVLECCRLVWPGFKKA